MLMTITGVMKNNLILLLLVLCIQLLPLHAQADDFRMVPGAEAQLSVLLNEPALVRPVSVTPLGRNWFTVVTDTHVFVDDVSVWQAAQVINDIEGYEVFYEGRRTRLSGNLVSRTDDELVIDFVSTTKAIGFNFRTPYRAVVRTLRDTGCEFLMEIRQSPQDNESNRSIRNFFSLRYVANVIINGRNYTYVRTFSSKDVDARILPAARSALERNSGPASKETLSLIIAAARKKSVP